MRFGVKILESFKSGIACHLSVIPNTGEGDQSIRTQLVSTIY